MPSNLRHTRVLTFTALYALLPACSDAPSLLPPAESDTTPSQVVQASEESADPLVRAFAAGLAEPTIRRGFLEALRDSPFKTHRLHLQSYLRGPGGSDLLAAGGRATGHSREELLALADSLPRMEIIVPVELDRLRWTGTEDVVVAGTTLPPTEAGRQGTLQGYTTAGEPVTVPLFSPLPYPLVLLRGTELSFGADPESRRQLAPRRDRPTISTPEEEFSISGCGPESALTDCVSQQEDSSAASTSGLQLPSGYTSECMVATGSTGDSDSDGVLDQCELEIARAFRPYMAYATNDSDTRREEYWAGKKGDNSYAVQIFYALSYYRDGGDPEMFGATGHLGDSEWILIQVSYSSGYWRLNRAKLSAHWGTSTDSTETVSYENLTYPNGTYRGRPLVWAARNKHANYKSRSACDAGALYQDSCDTNTYDTSSSYYTVRVLSTANLGNSWKRKLNCVYSRNNQTTDRPECYWSSDYAFLGWQTGSTKGAPPYRDALVAHNF